MILEEIFSAGLSVWEEKIAAAAYLDSVELEEGMLAAEVLQRLRMVMLKLRELPRHQADEFSLQAVLDEGC